MHITPIAKYLLKIILSITTITIVIIAFLLHIKFESKIESIKKIEYHENNIISKSLTPNFEFVIADLRIIANSENLKTFNNSNSNQRKEIESQFYNIALEKEVYDQIRLLDTVGNEQCRVNYNNGLIEIVSKEKLQNKASRYYFSESIRLKESDIYISPLDLNVEDGQIEEPLKPTIRFGTPVFNNNKEKIGVVVINYLANKMIMNIMQQHMHDNLNHEKIYLVNGDGYWFNHDSAHYNWNFMYPLRKEITLQTFFPDEWDSIKKIKTGQISTTNGIFTFQTIYPKQTLTKTTVNTDTQKDTYEWLLISYTPQFQINKIKKDILLEYTPILFIIIALSITLAFTLSVSYKRKHNYQENLQTINADLQYKNTELETAFTEIHSLVKQIKKSNATKDKFFSIIAHDLKGPMSGFVSYMELLKDNFEDYEKNQLKNVITEIHNSSKRIYDLIDNLLVWSRSQSKEMTFTPTKIEISYAIHETIQLLSATAAKKQISIEHTIPRIVVNADPNMLYTILRNLVSNAIKFTEHSGIIRIQAQIIDSKMVQISIIDSGIGILKKNFDKLFDIENHFTTLGTSSEKGTGLGLILCKEFVEKHGGKIWVNNNIPKGAVFHFTIPLISDTK